MRELIRYRPATEDDVPFFLRLYATTREDELRQVPWTDEQKRFFVEMQFSAQKAHYEQHYCDAEFLVIEKEGSAIGRLYIDRAPEDICIVDIALMPEHRGSGIGSILLKEILDEAAASSRAVKIYVEHFNPAMRLYERLGFRHIDTNGVYHLMEWRAS
ncbi:MAG TPA: GNAT family N-acetyltransferase [Thermoanaerobaculia bacterium]|nr:GNAT family N-acetyltransferase [Thermoanaerobaculia bacterium]